MANVIKHKRGSGSDPVASDLVVGEVAIRTDVGKLFTKMDNGSVAEIAGGGSDIAINTLSSSSATGGGSATFNGSAYRFTLSAPPSVSAQQLLVSINGVIQKPVAGTGQPSEGFSVDGTDIILGDAPATGSDFFILTFKSLGVSEPADNSVTSAKIVDGAIVNADINASAAIAGSKISPIFTSATEVQNSTFKITDSNPEILLAVPSGGLDSRIINDGSGNLIIGHGVNSDTPTERLRMDSSGNVGIKCSNPGSLLELNAAAGTKMGISLGAVGDNITASRYIGICKTADQTDLGVNSGFQGIEFGGPSSTNEGYLAFHTHDFGVESGERLRIDKNGNVGISLTNPGTKLDVGGAGTFRVANSASYQAGLNITNAVTTDLQVWIKNNAIAIGPSTASDIHFVTQGNSNTRMIVQDNGKVGIGTSSPAGQLHISSGASGDCKLIIEADTDNNDENDNPLIVFRQDGGLEESAIGMGFTSTASDNLLTLANSVTNGGISFATGTTNGYTNAVERVRIDTSGSLLLGTTSIVTDTRFVVDGNIAQRNSSTGSNQIVKKFVVSKAYTMSTSAVQVLHLDNWGTSAFEITAFRRDTASPHGAEIQKLYIGVQGSGSNMTDASIVTETKLTKGSIHNVTYSVSDNNNFVVLSATGNDDGGEAQTLTFYIIATGGNDGDVEVQ